jgi:hypothetical protein
VLSCSGLGAAAVAAATALHDPTETVHGELGGLTSFVARALQEHVRDVSAARILAAFALPPAEQLLAHVAAMSMGHMDFRDDFRAACAASTKCHFQYIQGRGVHFMRSCDDAAQNKARAWLSASIGVVHDAGHVEALCGLVQRRQYTHAQNAFLVTLVNTRAFMPRAEEWHALQNRAAPKTSSKVFALFRFE